MENPHMSTVAGEAAIAAEAGLSPEPARESLSHRAYCQIRSALTSSAMRPGHRLILRPLAHELNLSPTPVREALLRLVSEQALALDERGSAIVPITTIDGFRELTEMRGDLEARAAERAVRFASDAQIDEIEAVNVPCMAAYDRNEHVAMLDHNASFHRAICRAGRSQLILRTLEGLWMRLGPIYALSFDRPLDDLTGLRHPHLLMIDALRSRDAAAAREAAISDVRMGDRLLSPTLTD